MQTVSAAFDTAAAAVVRQPRQQFFVAWNGTDYVDESANAIEWDITVRLSIPGDGLAPMGTVDVGRVLLRDVEWRYSPWHTGGDSTIRSNISGATGLTGIACYLKAGFVLADTTTEYVTVFTGYIYGWQHDPAQKTVNLTLRDRAWKLLQRRGSTTAISTNTTTDAYIGAVLTLASWPADDRVLDSDPVVIPYAWLDDEPYWGDMAQIVSSVGGNLYANHSGKIVFESASHWIGHSSKAWTFDAGDVLPVPPQITPVDLVTEVVVEYAPRVPGQAGVLWQLDKPVFIRPAETREIEARFTHPALSVFTLADGEVSRMLDDDYYVTAPNGLNLYDFVRHSNTVTSTAAGATVTIQNMHTSFVACVRFLQLRGLPLIGGPTEQVKVGTGASNNYRTRSERGNPYLQTRQQAAFLANFLADRYEAIRPVWSIPNAPGVPHLELGDRIGVSDGRGLSSEREGFVIGINTSWRTPQDGGASQTPVLAQNIDVIDATGLWPSGTYYKIGTTALGAGVAWY